MAQHPLRNCNSLSLDAHASAFLTVDSDDTLLFACEWAQRHNKKMIPLGQGSNVVLAGDIDALVVRMETRDRRVLAEDDNKVLVRVAAGENWHDTVRWTLSRHWSGLENLALIPGTVGAAPVQNIGAYGVELASRVALVHTLDPGTGTVRAMTPNECRFAYRDSVFKGLLRDKLIITAVDLQLSRHPQLDISYPALASYLQRRKVTDPTSRQVFDAVVAIRRSKLPSPQALPNAGSFFKNPLVPDRQAGELSARFSGLPVFAQKDGKTKIAAAWMIQHCGWKGHRRGGVGVHPQHALVLINYGSDSGRELLALAADIAASVQTVFGVALDIEPRIYG